MDYSDAQKMFNAARTKAQRQADDLRFMRLLAERWPLLTKAERGEISHRVMWSKALAGKPKPTTRKSQDD